MTSSSSNSLVRRHPGRDVLDELLPARRAPEHDEALGSLACPLVRHADDARVGHGGVSQQHRLELGGRHLEAADLDQLLDAVDDREPAVAVDGRDVPRAQPAVARSPRRWRRAVAQIALHDLRAADEQLARLLVLDLLAGRDVDDARLRAGTRGPMVPDAVGASNGVMCVTGLASVMP